MSWLTWINSIHLIFILGGYMCMWVIIWWVTGGPRSRVLRARTKSQPGRDLRLAELLSWDLVRASTSLSCSTGTWLFAPPRRVARLGLGRLLHHAGFLSWDLSRASASLSCSVGTWSFTLPRRVARLGFGWLRWVVKDHGFTLGTSFLGTRH